ncbi:DUF2336 domain-containing protein [Brevundimonas naejangsanensis]|uniref:DUF2336 domain-containing protein n=1 Tax=Brevundimonas naejangsanensis TaxID=588932 RepID=A0A494RLJ6_9CAUL|nr:DUF2336 domain-containing protein [Brevundimonas naejangsanensis]AYG95530.1 DUF2336 domain-containing protein [Brevundimonas naejangsanensis]
MGSIEAFEPSRPDEPLPLASLHQLLDLAAGRPPQEQQRLLFGVADLYHSVGGQTRAPGALTEVFIALVRAAERDIRRALAERLADAAWAPADLVRLLAADAIEIARPVIAASPLLLDADLLALLDEASLDHQVQVALRPGLGAEVARAILDRGDPAVMTALASNRTARLSGADMIRLVDGARFMAALRAPLTRHPALSEDLALRLYQWVGDALKQAISERFDLDPSRLNQTVSEAARAAALSSPDEAAARLAAKLHAADQLRPATLIRALREQKLDLFVHALALLGGLEVEQVRRALRGDTARPLFLACTAAGLDRATFPAVLREIRQLNRGLPHDPDGEAWRPAQRSAAQAAYEFRLLMAPEDSPSV